MRTVYISLPTVEAVQRFVEIISPLPGQFDLLSDEYVLDAKSLMGIFKLDLIQPIKLRIEKDSEETMNAIDNYIVENPPGMPDMEEPPETTVLKDLSGRPELEE